MAHKTLIDGTAYTVSGGRTLADGTSYNVKNGKVLVDGTAYDISFILPAEIVDIWSNGVINCIAYANGFWVVGGQCRSDAYIAYATNLDGPWTTKRLWTSYGDGEDSTINCIAYADGYWVVGGCYDYDATRCYGRIAYTADPTGSWTTKDIWATSNTANDIRCITYADGYWMVGGSYYYLYISGLFNYRYNAEIAYTTDLTGEWTNQSLRYASGPGPIINCITYANGFWVAGGDDFIAYTTDPTDTWTLRDIWSTSIRDVTYANGYWMVCGDGENSVAYATSPDGTWTIKDLESVGYSHTYIESITYACDYWVACGYRDRTLYGETTYYACIFYATTPDSTWTTKDLWSDSNGSAALKCITYDNDCLVVGGRSDSYARIAHATSLEGFKKI